MTGDETYSEKAARARRGIAVANLVREVVLYLTIALAIVGGVVLIKRLNERDALRDRLEENRDRLREEALRRERAEEDARDAQREKARAEERERKRIEEERERKRREKELADENAARLAEIERKKAANAAQERYRNTLRKMQSMEIDYFDAMPDADRPANAPKGANYIILVADSANASEPRLFEMLAGGNGAFSMRTIAETLDGCRDVPKSEFAGIIRQNDYIIAHKDKAFLHRSKSYKKERDFPVPRSGGVFNASKEFLGDIYGTLGEKNVRRAPNFKWEVEFVAATRTSYPLVELSLGENLAHRDVRDVLVAQIMEKEENELREKEERAARLNNMRFDKPAQYFGTEIQAMAIGGIVGAVLAGVAVMMMRPATIIATSVAGGYALTLAILAIASGSIEAKTAFWPMIVGFSVLGCIIQFISCKHD